MRWKLIKRRFSAYAPRVSVRRHVPWPLRWGFAALIFGFSAALALWAFEFGRDLAGLDRASKVELTKLRDEVLALRVDRDKAQSIANTAESLLKTERTTQEQLAKQLKQAESDNQALKSDLGFYERLLPAPGSGLGIRGLQAEVTAPGQMSYLLLVIQSGKANPDFNGKYDISVTGTLDGKPWSQTAIGGSKPLVVKQSARLEGMVEIPASVVVKTVQARVMDAAGVVRSTQQARF